MMRSVAMAVAALSAFAVPGLASVPPVAGTQAPEVPVRAVAPMPPGAPDPGAWSFTPAADAPDRADPLDPGRLGYQRIAGEVRPELILAQRTIDRQWGPSDDSIYVEVDLPGWKSEAGAAGLSLALPGAGQAYVGEGNAWVYAAIELAGWGGWLWYRHDASELNDQAAGVAGEPTAPTSGWTYDRWASATGGDPADIEGLYAVDRESFLTAIGSDARYAAGWVSPTTQGDFVSLRDRSDSRLRRSRLYGTALWVNHIVSAANALRAARLHNMPLVRNVGMRVEPHLRRGRAGVTMTLVRKF